METDALGCPLPLWQDHDKNHALCRVLGRPFSFTLCVAFDPSHDHVLWLRGLGQPGTSKGWEDCHGMVGLLRVHRVGLPGIDWLVGVSAFWKDPGRMVWVRSMRWMTSRDKETEIDYPSLHVCLLA